MQAREKGGTGEGSRSEVRGFRNFEPRTSNFRIAHFAHVARVTLYGR